VTFWKFPVALPEPRCGGCAPKAMSYMNDTIVSLTAFSGCWFSEASMNGLVERASETMGGCSGRDSEGRSLNIVGRHGRILLA
jgi:hypothetical protein